MENNINNKNIFELGAEIILPENSISEKIILAKKENRPLVVKLGFDPTAPDLHLGHTVVLKKLKQFQDAGHTVVVIIGDFTAGIGDPTGKNKTRPPLSQDKIEENSKTYINQLSKVLDVDKVEIRYNSEWLAKMNLSDVIKLLSSYNLGRMLTRDDFRKRYESDIPIAMHELVYPLLQGYDSLAIKSDIEIGGTDQLFNLQVARFLQEVNGLPAQAIICMPLLRGTDGVNKMSKSLNNYIGITEEARQMFGKAMSVPDALLNEYIDLVSNFDQIEKEQMKKTLKNGDNPMNLKKKVAFDIVEQFHGKDSAQDASDFFYNQFQDKSHDKVEYVEKKISDLKIDDNKIDLVTLLFLLKVRVSKTACRSLIEQGGVLIDDKKIIDPKFDVIANGNDFFLKCGKMNFYKIILK
ncbi:MAG: tyrosine--tRNA ligase [Candidatus Shapirobacteria bacterium]|jgi:tyrosyl-tRNA synthetase